MLGLGRLRLSSRAMLSPLEGVSDVGFRDLCVQQGAALTWTEMVRAQAIARNNGAALDLIDTHDAADRTPTGLQMLAKSADDVHRALQRIHDLSTDADRRRRAGVGADIDESAAAAAANSLSHSGADCSESERTAANQPFASFAANRASAASGSGSCNRSGGSSQDRRQSRDHAGASGGRDQHQPRSSRHGGQSEADANTNKARGHFRNIIAVDLNFGCPSPDVIRDGAGPALLKRRAKLADIFAALATWKSAPASGSGSGAAAGFGSASGAGSGFGFAAASGSNSDSAHQNHSASRSHNMSRFGSFTSNGTSTSTGTGTDAGLLRQLHGYGAVGCKIRLGLNAQEGVAGAKVYLHAVEAAARAGLDYVVVHARHAGQRSRDAPKWSAIAECVRAVAGSNTLIIGNGDVFSLDEARRMMHETQCAGVMVARAAIHNPWVFRDLAALTLPPAPISSSSSFSASSSPSSSSSSSSPSSSYWPTVAEVDAAALAYSQRAHTHATRQKYIDFHTANFARLRAAVIAGDRTRKPTAVTKSTHFS